MIKLERHKQTPSFKVYEVEISVSQIDGFNRGYENITEVFNVCCRYEETAKTTAREWLGYMYPELDKHSFCIEYKVKDILENVIRHY